MYIYLCNFGIQKKVQPRAFSPVCESRRLAKQSFNHDYLTT